MRTKPLSSSIDWHPPPYYCGYFGTARVLELMFGESNRNFVTLLTASAGSTTVGHELTVPARSVRTTRRQIPAAGVTWERNYGAFCKEIAARPILYPGRQWRSTSNSETVDITFSVAGFPSIPSFMPSCGARRHRRFVSSPWPGAGLRSHCILPGESRDNRRIPTRRKGRVRADARGVPASVSCALF